MGSTWRTLSIYILIKKGECFYRPLWPRIAYHFFRIFAIIYESISKNVFPEAPSIRFTYVFDSIHKTCPVAKMVAIHEHFYICYVVDLIACARSTFGNDRILSSFFSFILTSNKIAYLAFRFYMILKNVDTTTGAHKLDNRHTCCKSYDGALAPGTSTPTAPQLYTCL